MKKFLSIFTAAVCVLACAFSFTACGGNNSGDDNTHTTHNWSTTYTQDGDRHYQTCDGCNEKQYNNHDYGTSGVCVCGKEKPVEIHTHNWSTTYTQDGDRHYQTCDGCEEKQYNNHDYGTSGVCVCGKQKPVTVIAVESVTLNESELTLEIDETETLTATVKPDNATDKTVTYSVEPAGIVTVDNSGKVTAVAAGTATITATTDGKTATCSVTVNAPVTNADIINALDTYCKENLVKQNLSFADNMENVKDGRWYISIDENGNILSATFAYNYVRVVDVAYFAIGKITFNTSVSARNLINGNLGEVINSREYRMIRGYDPTIQETRSELCYAICDKAFESDGTVIARYIIDSGIAASDSVLTGTVNMFTVIEVTDKGVQQANVNIKTSSSDAAYIARLNNANDYRVLDEYGVSYTLVGTKLENNDLPF